MSETLQNMPLRSYRPLFLALFFIFSLLCHNSFAAPGLKPLPFNPDWRPKRLVQIADSGFSRRRYQEAFTIYDFILKERGQYSPQMLLKMSAYSEGSGNATQALYYLNLYYLLNPNGDVRQKIEDLATANALQGYVFSELDYLIFLYNQYFVYICSFHLLMALLFLGIMVYRKWKGLALIYNPLFFIVFLLAAGFTANFGQIYRRGIIASEHAMLMQGPSGGSDFVQYVEKGNKLVVSDKNDIWYKVEWQGQSSWINEKNLLLIEN